MREPKFSRVGPLGVYDWPAASSAGERPVILFCHATGMHGRVWDRVIECLPEHRCIALDLQGHGRASKPEPPAHWWAFAESVAEFAAAEKPGLIGAGHSMGGHSLIGAADRAPGAFAGLLLLDPVVRPPDSYTGPWSIGNYVAKRRNDWASSAEMFERFRTRPPFDGWDPRALQDYCDHALDGKVLACSPAFEASVYSNSTLPEAAIHGAIARLDIPVRIVRAHGTLAHGSLDMNVSPTDPELVRYFRQASDEVWEDCSHFIPMEQPDRVAQALVEFSSRIRPLRAAG